jgi:hypothetical protein
MSHYNAEFSGGRGFPKRFITDAPRPCRVTGGCYHTPVPQEPCVQVSPHTAHAAIRHREAPAGGKPSPPTSRYGFLLSLRLPVRSAVTCRHECPVSVRANCGETFRNLSRDPPPVGSLRPFGLRHDRYPHHYNATFASSDIPYPHPLRYALRLPTSLRRRNTGLPCSA